MSAAAVTHEGFMNASRMILPRVGVGVGEGVRGGVVGHPSISLTGRAASKADGALRAICGGGF